MKKTILVLLTAAVCCLGLTACKTNDTGTSENMTSAPAASELPNPEVNRQTMPNSGMVTDHNGIIGDADDMIPDSSGSGIGDALNNAADNAGDTIDNAADNVGEIASDVTKNVGDTVSDVAGNVGDTVSDVAGNVGDTISSITDHAGDIVSNAADNAGDMADSSEG